MSYMESISVTRTSIQRLGKTLNFICRIATVIFIIFMILSIVAAGISTLLPNTISKFQGFFEQNTVFRVLQYAADLNNMEPGFFSAIGAAVTSVTFAIMALYTRSFQKLLMEMVGNEKPFSMNVAKSIRKRSYALLLMLFYNPVIAVFVFLIVLLFSYFVEYGAHIQDKADQTNRIQEEMIVSFAEITENKSGQTGKHVRRVAEYSRILATELGLDKDAAENLRLASTMHDIGKLMIPSEILEKPGKLTDEEFEQMKGHTTAGAQILDRVMATVPGSDEGYLNEAKTMALYHHEKWNGKGYPYGISGEDIPLSARIMAVADVFDALVSTRSYKKGFPFEKAISIIEESIGTHFDPLVANAFLNVQDKAREIMEKNYTTE